jgi:hypothetical protein
MKKHSSKPSTTASDERFVCRIDVTYDNVACQFRAKVWVGYPVPGQMIAEAEGDTVKAATEFACDELVERFAK